MKNQKHVPSFEEFLNEKNEYLNERTKFDVQKLLSKVDDELYNIIKWKDDASCYVSAPADAADIIAAVKSKYPKSSWDPKTNLLVFESEEFLNEGKSQKWIVFLPIKKDNIIDIEDSLFGVYNDEEYDRIAPFDKVNNYTTSLSFADMKTAKEFEELVRKAKGNTKSSAYSKATEFEKNNKI